MCGVFATLLDFTPRFKEVQKISTVTLIQNESSMDLGNLLMNTKVNPSDFKKIPTVWAIFLNVATT